MKQLLEFIPLVLFFITYKMFGVRDAIINALFAIVLLVAQFQFNTPLVKKLLGKEIQLPDNVWNKLNVGWAGFFILCMLVNIYISQNMSEDAWVDFKSFGLLGMTFVATIVSGAYIYRYLPKDDQKNDGDK